MPLRIENAVDLHVHFSLDTIGGSLEFGDHFHAVPAFETACEARDNGYAAVVLKPHGFASQALAQNLEMAVPGIRLFGGICTDHLTGGLNVYAVEAALSLGAKVVWLPTIHSSVDFGNYPMRDRHQALGPVHVLDADGELLPDVHEIADLVRQTGAVLATGHISGTEHHAVVTAFARSQPVLVTHAGAEGGARLTPSEAAQLADLGAVIELTALNCHEVLGLPAKTPEQMAGYIQAIGVERCALATDYGWAGAESGIPRPAGGFVEFLETMWAIGVPERDLTTMASLNPGRLLALPFA